MTQRLRGSSGLRRTMLVLAAIACMVGLSLSGSHPWATARAETSAEFISLADVKPGMKGTGKTVVEGTRIDTFDVEILGLLRGETATGDLVLVRVSGKPVEAAGGIAAGMSGSPVYVNGRLLGAIAYGYESADHYIGLVTPIEEMLKVFAAAKRPVPAQASLSSPIRLQDRIVRKVVLAASPEEAAHLAAERPDDTLVMVPAMTPVMTSGIPRRAFERLSRKLSPFGLKAVQGGGGGVQADGGEASLEPGSAIGVQLVRGDVSVTAIGTVTYRKGNEALAFGHSLLGRGNSGYLATGASIHHVVSGDVMPFKVASPLGIAGSIVQDRIHGVLVDLGKTPSTIPVNATVRDRDTGTTRMLRADIVRDEMLSADLAGIFVLSCLDATVNRVGRGTSRVTFEIHGKGLPEPVARDNMFYSPADISADSIGELLEYLSAVIDNEFAEVEVTGVKAEFEVREARQTARIERAEAVTKVARAGDTVEVKVRLQPFRGIPEIKAVQIKIPDETPAGTLYLAVRGGGVPPAEEGVEGDDKSAHPTVAESLENLVRELMARERNNDVVVEFYPGEASSEEDAVPADGRAAPGSPVGSGRPRQGEDLPRRGEKDHRGEGAGAGTGSKGLVKAVLTTGYVIEGETTVELRIEGAGSEPNAEPIP
ncbi:MAG: SpoIVB peptidase S55 domain-containing protein [Bacillota bacterium]